MARRRRARGGLPLALACLLLVSCASASVPAGLPGTPARGGQIALSVLSDTIYLVDPATGRRTPLVEDLIDFQSGFAAWAPDRRHLAYGNEGVHVLDLASRDVRTLVEHFSMSMPAWAPDGTSLAYGDGRNLWITPVDRQDATYVRLPISLAPLSMAWSPGTDIAFQGLALECRVPYGCTSTDRSDIWVVHPDGTALRRISRIERADSPRWSPDGSRLLFIRRTRPADAAGELWVVRADGSDARQLVPGSNVAAADWSPDGARLALVRAEGRAPSALQLWVGEADGTGMRARGNPFPGGPATLDW